VSRPFQTRSFFELLGDFCICGLSATLPFSLKFVLSFRYASSWSPAFGVRIFFVDP